ncbi:MAG: response regulator transcription factor [Chloroflexi bacterium]|nr:response regulator transcription factor [Chloroflexota bacterium]
MDVIRVLLAEDHTIVRKGLCALLSEERHIQVVGEAETGRQALEKTQELRPDIVVMDISMPDMNGAEATRQIKRQFPEIKILVLSMYTNEEYVLRLLRAGASGYVVKQAAPEELLLAIEAIYRGQAFLSPSISRGVIEKFLQATEEALPPDKFNELTPREREVLQLIAEGCTNQEIANRLHISIRTVETHRANLMKKLDIHTTAELTQYAIRRGIINLNN